MVQRKKLYMAKNMSSLMEMTKLDPKLSDKTSTNILSKLYSEALHYLSGGDEEAAFVFFMRFIEISMKGQRSPDMNAKLKDAFLRCEKMKESLAARYIEEHIENSLSPLPAPPTGIDSFPDIPNGSIHTIIQRNTSIGGPAVTKDWKEHSNGIPNGTTKTAEQTDSTDQPSSKIHPTKYLQLVAIDEVKGLLQTKKALLIDCRSSEAFADSHINTSSSVINVGKIYSGITAATIQQSLNDEAKMLFAARQSFEKVVLVDWDGDQSNSPASRVSKVHEALTKWVRAEEAVTCFYLKNGYRFWCRAYPHDTTKSTPRIELNEEAKATLPIIGDDLYQFEKLEPEVKPKLPNNPPVVKMEKPVSTPKPEPVTSQKVLPPEQSPSKPSPLENGPVPKPSLPPSAKTDQEKCNELFTKVDQTSQDTVLKFTKSVNEKILKPRTRSEAETSGHLIQDHRSLKPSLIRSRSLSDIYEESANKETFDRTIIEPKEIRKPSIDRSLKPSSSLDTATVHKPKETPNDVVSVKIRTEVKAVPLKPVIPPKSRRSQSPVQAYRFGRIDRTSGLRNLRNTCYMNSVIQALAHSAEFAQYFVRREQEKSHLEPKRAVLPSLFSRLLGQLWSQNETRDSLMDFRSYIGSRMPMYQSSEQQDSHEFLLNLLSALHDDLNIPSTDVKKTVDNPDLVVTFAMLANELDRFYISHSERQMSVVTKNYEGILLSGLKCHTCHSDSYTFQVFNVLSVPIPPWQEVDIQACFDQFFKEEKIDEWSCPCCKAKRSATKQMKIARLPKHLIIHLVRFKNDPHTFSSLRKVSNRVQFTDELDTRDFAQYVYSKSVQLRSYSLYGVVKHYGTLSSGHYYSECRFLPNQQWYRYNDLEVTSVARAFPEVDDTYMLFYSCENYRNEP